MVVTRTAAQRVGSAAWGAMADALPGVSCGMRVVLVSSAATRKPDASPAQSLAPLHAVVVAMGMPAVTRIAALVVPPVVRAAAAALELNALLMSDGQAPLGAATVKVLTTAPLSSHHKSPVCLDCEAARKRPLTAADRAALRQPTHEGTARGAAAALGPWHCVASCVAVLPPQAS